jgi:hypothetical protein
MWWRRVCARRLRPEEMIVARFPFVSALLALAAACFTSGCPMLVGDEFQIGDESSRAGDGGEAQAGAETSGAGTLSLGGHLHGGAAGHPASSAEGGAAGTPANAEGGASAGDTNAGGPSAGSQGTCDDGRQSPGESDRDCGGACEPCEDGSSCRLPGGLHALPRWHLLHRLRQRRRLPRHDAGLSSRPGLSSRMQRRERVLEPERRMPERVSLRRELRGRKIVRRSGARVHQRSLRARLRRRASLRPGPNLVRHGSLQR